MAFDFKTSHTVVFSPEISSRSHSQHVLSEVNEATSRLPKQCPTLDRTRFYSVPSRLSLFTKMPWRPRNARARFVSPILVSSISRLEFFTLTLLDSIAQLTCHNSEACSLYQPEVIQCTNTGDDGTGNIQWKVRAPLLQECASGISDMSCTATI